jgi:hypothetical protein
MTAAAIYFLLVFGLFLVSLALLTALFRALGLEEFD